MIDVAGFQLSSMEYAIVLETKRVTTGVFKVCIPRLVPKLDHDKVAIKSVSPNKGRLLNSKFKVSGYKTQNFLEAENIMGITKKHLGNVTGMAKSKGITEKETVNRMPIKMIHKKGPPHPPHEHVIKKPFEFTDMVYEDLHRNKVSKGSKVIVSFVGGAIYDVKVLYIPGSVERGD